MKNYAFVNITPELSRHFAGLDVPVWVHRLGSWESVKLSQIGFNTHLNSGHPRKSNSMLDIMAVELCSTGNVITMSEKLHIGPAVNTAVNMLARTYLIMPGVKVVIHPGFSANQIVCFDINDVEIL